MDFTERVMGWRADLKLVAGTKSQTALACQCYNWATNPTTIRTDQEARIAQKLANHARVYLVSGQYVESDNGRLHPVDAVEKLEKF